MVHILKTCVCTVSENWCRDSDAFFNLTLELDLVRALSSRANQSSEYYLYDNLLFIIPLLHHPFYF